MNKERKILGWNLIVLVIATIIISVLFGISADAYRSLGFLVAYAIYIGIHIILNFIIAIVLFFKKNSETAKAFLFAAVVVLLIGFSSCWGIGTAIQ